MATPFKLINHHNELRKNSILLAYRGSIAHGTYRPNHESNSIDDIDLISVFIPPIDYYIGLREFNKSLYPDLSCGTKEIKIDEFDIVCYEVKKFLHLLSKGNPNVLSTLWLDESHFMRTTKAGQKIIDNRNLFVSKQAFFSFIGYAKDQLYKMTHLAFKGYMGEKRKRLVEKFGYDTKNASHLIRLLRMAIEFLNTGDLIVTRPDAQELLQIKDGMWTLERVKKEAENLFKAANLAYTKSELPDNVNLMKINNLCQEIISLGSGR